MTNPNIPVREWKTVRAALAEQLKAGHGGRIEETTCVRMAEHLLDSGLIDVDLLRPPSSRPVRQVVPVQVDTYESLVVQIEAVQWDGSAEHAGYVVDWILAGPNQESSLARFVGVGEEHPLRYAAEYDFDENLILAAPAFIVIKTLDADARLDIDDWALRGTEGEHYPCKPSVFARKYRAVTS